MDHPTSQPIADLLLEEREAIVRRWLERVSGRVTVDDRYLFPSEDLLDHVPRLIAGIARALVGDEPITVDTPVVLKARELGRLRFEQGFSAHQILWEYQLLGSVILNRLEEGGLYLEGREGQVVIRRLFEALNAVQRSTMEEFLDHYERTIHEREDRLRGFNHALSHELRNEIGAILGAARMLNEGFVVEDQGERSRFVSIVVENAERIDHLVQNLVELSRVEEGSRRHRNVLLQHAMEEAARHLRSFAESRSVELRLPESVPTVEVNAAVVELALTNLIANGIKYHDPAQQERWVEVRCRPASDPDQLVVEVRDNGRGVAERERPRLFERFFRSEASADVDGTGLGLHLVKTAVGGIGGEVWAEFPEPKGSIFAFALPARRQEDAP